MTAEARVLDAIEDYCGEGLIAFPEARETCEHLGVNSDEAVGQARAALRSILNDGRLRLYEGMALDPDPQEANRNRVEELLGSDGSFFYGPTGEEMRAFFTVACR